MKREIKVFRLIKNSLLFRLAKPPLKIYYVLSLFTISFFPIYHFFNKNLRNCCIFFKTYLSTIFIVIVQQYLLYFQLKQDCSEYLCFITDSHCQNILLTFVQFLLTTNKQNIFIIPKY